jgi:hypothetical protein
MKENEKITRTKRRTKKKNTVSMIWSYVRVDLSHYFPNKIVWENDEP